MSLQAVGANGGGALGLDPGRHPGFISPLQFGFRRFRSTAHPLLRLEHDISAVFENGKFLLAVFFNLQKAYDST